MAESGTPIDWVEIIKALGPYIVAVFSAGFAFFQSWKVAQVTKAKDVEIAKLSHKHILDIEQMKVRRAREERLMLLAAPRQLAYENFFRAYWQYVSDDNFETFSVVSKCLEELKAETWSANQNELIALCQYYDDERLPSVVDGWFTAKYAFLEIAAQVINAPESDEANRQSLNETLKDYEIRSKKYYQAIFKVLAQIDKDALSF